MTSHPTITATDAAIRVRDVSKTYHDGQSSIQALADISLTLGPGEFVCLVGASGCGKSTLLNLIAGLYRLDSGSIDTYGRSVALMFQEPALFPWLTVAQNVEMAMRFRQVPKHTRITRTEELLDLVHLAGFGQARPHELSGGMQQRAALARALAQDAEILLMDEPFASLDAMTRSVLHDEFERIWQTTGSTVLFVTHDVREAVRLGDRVVLLSSRPGRVVTSWSVDVPRPRHEETPGVTDMVNKVLEGLKMEVRRHGR